MPAGQGYQHPDQIIHEIADIVRVLSKIPEGEWGGVISLVLA
jgi:hypothetical protein